VSVRKQRVCCSEPRLHGCDLARPGLLPSAHTATPAAHAYGGCRPTAPPIPRLGLYGGVRSRLKRICCVLLFCCAENEQGNHEASQIHHFGGQDYCV